MKIRELYTGQRPFSYIIFSQERADAVENLLDNLDKGGYRYWFNAKLSPDEDDLSLILNRMKNAAVTVLIMTPGIAQDQFASDMLEYSIAKRKPLVLYMTEHTPELLVYLNKILERAKTAVIFREWEQRFETCSTLRQALSSTKGFTDEGAEKIFNEALEALRSEDATQASLTEAMKNIMLTANNEYAPALNFLGNLALEKARNGHESYSTAVAYYKAAVKLGNVDAIHTLGSLIADGEGFSRNYAVAEPYISLAAAHGVTDAQYRYALMLDSGNGVAKNKTEATKWFKKALEGGDRRAYLPLAKRFLDGDTVHRNETIAAQYFTEAAKDGITEAEYILAKLYRDGVGVKKDSAKAEEYFRKAAEKDIPEAQYEYALILQERESYTEAFRWLAYAATEREYDQKIPPEILYQLGECYSHGLGVETDKKTAFLYYHKAALAGETRARAAVAECYRHGIGVAVNRRAADFYAYGN